MKKCRIVFLLGCMVLFGFMLINEGNAYAYEWTEDFETNKMRGKISKDGKECWIQYIEKSMVKNHTLTIPNKVKGAKVVCIGRPEDPEDESYNIFGEAPADCLGGISKQCKQLKNIVVPDSVEKIEHYCFAGLSGLVTIRLPKKLNTISDMAFCGCRSLKVLKLPQSVTSIDDEAFLGCENLKTLSMGKNVFYLSNSALVGCRSLEKISIHKDNKILGARKGYIYKKGSKSIMLIYAQQKTFTIPNGIKAISENSLQSGKIRKVKIPESVTVIGNDAFSVNQDLRLIVSKKNKTFANLGKHVIKKTDGTLVCMYAYNSKDLVLPKGIKIVQEYMSVIGNVNDLRTLVFPTTLRTVMLTPEHYTKFFSYFDLKEMHFKGKKAPVFIYPFSSGKTIYVPKGRKKEYKAALTMNNKTFDTTIKED